MQSPPTNCPRCEAEQKFVPRVRATTHSWQEEYIRCAVCRWETVLRYTTPEIETVWIKLRGYNRRADHEVRRHGQPQGSTLSARLRLRQELARLIHELRGKMVEEIGTAAPHSHPA